MPIADRVRDLMVLTVPRLAVDEQVSPVEPDLFLEDDGCARAFHKAFVYDDTPRMAVLDEVLDLMALADPLVGQMAAEGGVPPEDYSDFPADGTEALWRIPERAPEAPYEVPEDACACFAALMATTHGFEAQPDWAGIGILAGAVPSLDDIPFGETGWAFDLPEDCSFVADFMALDAPEAPVPAPAGIQAIAPAPSFPMIAAPEIPEGVPDSMEIPAAVSSDSVQGVSQAVPVESTPLVMFSFGPQNAPERGWRVRFSF